MILPGQDPEAIARAGAALLRGLAVGLPTETVYGLAANADDDAAVARIFALKGRPADHPLIVHLAHARGVARGVDHYATNVPEVARRLIAHCWPGPLTLVLPRRAGVAQAAAAGQASIALRCPAHPVAQALLNWGQITIHRTAPHSENLQLGSDPDYLMRVEKADKLCSDPNFWGLAAPSANRFGRVSPTTAAHVADEFGDALLVLDGGPCTVGIESTIVDCTRRDPVLLRPGAWTAAQLSAICRQDVHVAAASAAPADGAAPRVAGSLASHYAPRARVRLAAADQLLATLAAGADAPATALWSSQRPAQWAGPWQAMPTEAVQVAQQLFATLRALDALGVAEIVVQAPPPGAAWDAVRDRLTRAAHPLRLRD